MTKGQVQYWEHRRNGRRGGSGRAYAYMEDFFGRGTIGIAR